jgi:hypothetical protein
MKKEKTTHNMGLHTEQPDYYKYHPEKRRNKKDHITGIWQKSGLRATTSKCCLTTAIELITV